MSLIVMHTTVVSFECIHWKTDVCLFVCLLICLLVRSFVCLFVCLFVRLFVCLHGIIWYLVTDVSETLLLLFYTFICKSYICF